MDAYKNFSSDVDSFSIFVTRENNCPDVNLTRLTFVCNYHKVCRRFDNSPGFMPALIIIHGKKIKNKKISTVMYYVRVAQWCNLLYCNDSGAVERSGLIHTNTNIKTCML